MVTQIVEGEREGKGEVAYSLNSFKDLCFGWEELLCQLVALNYFGK